MKEIVAMVRLFKGGLEIQTDRNEYTFLGLAKLGYRATDWRKIHVNCKINVRRVFAQETQ